MDEKKAQEDKNPKDIFEDTISNITRNYAHRAPVELPNQEQLTVKLVPLALVEKLVESRGDLEVYLSLVFTLFGTFLGTVLTAFTVEFKDYGRPVIIFLVVLSIALAFSSIRLFVLYRRYKSTKILIFNSYGQSNP